MIYQRLIVLLTYAVFSSACAPDNSAIGNVEGKVLEVRVTSEREFRSVGDPVGGAILGGLVAGTTGAIIGTAMESDGKLNLESKLQGCRVFVRLKDGTKVVFTTILSQSFPSDLISCSLLRPGDYVNFSYEKTMNGYEGYWFLRTYGQIIPPGN